MYALVYIHLETISKYCYNNNIYNNNRIYDGCISVVKWIQEVLKGLNVQFTELHSKPAENWCNTDIRHVWQHLKWITRATSVRW